MTTWFTSDTHFGHERINELANRPFTSVEEMNEAIIERWNAVVAPEDTVYHLGDVAMGKIADSLPLIGRLNGTKILVEGNHDRTFTDKGKKREPEWRQKYLEVFAAVRDNYAVMIEGREVMLSHFPYDGDSHDEDRFAGDRLVDKGAALLHGHTHALAQVSHSKAKSLQIHVGVDAWEFAPVSEETVAVLLRAYYGLFDYKGSDTA